MDPESIANRVDDLVHADTQVHDQGVDLTLAEVHTIDAPGRVDFGGGELTDAILEPHERQRRYPDDDYDWWHLDAGHYVIEHNESITDRPALVCETRPALRERGAFHPTVLVPPLESVPLAVGGNGIRLKENARVSTLRSLK